MAYQKPTLFGVAYASRLFREVDGDQAFETLRRETGPSLNSRFPDRNGHAQALLKWLNNWGCRIAAKSSGHVISRLGRIIIWRQPFTSGK
jgi:hypothetical protein